MKRVIFTCPTLKGELLQALQETGCGDTVIVLPQRLHSVPQELHTYLQDCIDRTANVDRIIVLPSGCGGSTAGLRATTAELVVPRSRDCIDILLSGEKLADVRQKRDMAGVFMTKDWAGFQKRSDLDFDKLVRKHGTEGAKAFLRKVYGKFNHFYLIDTGCYDLEPVRTYLKPTLDAIDGTLTVIRGTCGILKKVAANRIDEDFVSVPRGGEVPQGFSMPNFL